MVSAFKWDSFFKSLFLWSHWYHQSTCSTNWPTVCDRLQKAISYKSKWFFHHQSGQAFESISTLMLTYVHGQFHVALLQFSLIRLKRMQVLSPQSMGKSFLPSLPALQCAKLSLVPFKQHTWPIFLDLRMLLSSLEIVPMGTCPDKRPWALSLVTKIHSGFSLV